MRWAWSSTCKCVYLPSRSLEDCQNVKCPNGKVCLLVKNTGEPLCYPKVHCNPALNPEPVCGTNGVTYRNMCAMRLSKSKRGRTPDLAHKGPCGTIRKSAVRLCVTDGRLRSREYLSARSVRVRRTLCLLEETTSRLYSLPVSVELLD